MLELLPVDFVRRCVSIRVVVSDVDGTLTDGGMYYTAEKEVMKRFSARDGMGVTLLQRSGIEVVLMTSDKTGIADARGRKLGIKCVLEGVKDKSSALNELAVLLNVTLSEIAYIGDDVNDEAPLKLSGISACPSDSAHEVRKWAQYVCKHSGGNGAFRELSEIILLAQNKHISLHETI